MNFSWVILFHVIGDVIFQSKRMMEEKHHSLDWLFLHALTYGICLLPVGLNFAFINALFHFLIDMQTSRFTNYYWKIARWDKFALVICLDQAAHISLLWLTFRRL